MAQIPEFVRQDRRGRQRARITSSFSQRAWPSGHASAGGSSRSREPRSPGTAASRCSSFTPIGGRRRSRWRRRIPTGSSSRTEAIRRRAEPCFVETTPSGRRAPSKRCTGTPRRRACLSLCLDGVGAVEDLDAGLGARDPPVGQQSMSIAVDQEHRVTPRELFFDLVFVFAFTQVATLLTNDPTFAGIGRGSSSWRRSGGRGRPTRGSRTSSTRRRASSACRCGGADRDVRRGPRGARSGSTTRACSSASPSSSSARCTCFFKRSPAEATPTRSAPCSVGSVVAARRDLDPRRRPSWTARGSGSGSLRWSPFTGAAWTGSGPAA